MSKQGVRRWLVPAGTAVVVLALVVGIWAVLRPGQSAGSPGSSGSFASGDAGSGTGTVGTGSGSSSGSAGSGGASSVPGSPGPPIATTKPGTGGTMVPGGPVGPPPHLTRADGVMINSFYEYDPTHLAINYTTGTPACSGRVRLTTVRETPRSVVVTLTRQKPTIARGMMCADIAMLKDVHITLRAPLGDRTVRDGSFGRSVVPRGTSPNDPTQVK